MGGMLPGPGILGFIMAAAGVLNGGSVISDGSWTNTDASIGAGIDSYYEYLFKGYILMGDEELLHRFNRHYDAITKYMSLSTDLNSESGDGSCMKTVHMHMPHRQARNYIDALLAFWPGNTQKLTLFFHSF